MHNAQVSIKNALQTYFGFSDFLDGQEAVIKDVLSGKHVLAVRPTGGGKSLCYQLPAVCSQKLTLVVCPLISLMSDQVTELKRRGIRAEQLNSAQSLSQRIQVERDLT